MAAFTLKLAHLYPEQLNMYGDRGNVLVLYQRCHWRCIQLEVQAVGPGDALDPEASDLIFIGGGQDAQQTDVAEDLHRHKAQALHQAHQAEVPILAVCGGYQFLGHYYRPHQGPELKGLGLLDFVTVAGHKRMIGNVVIESRLSPEAAPVQLIGFENHSGRTLLGAGVTPLGRVISGFGNNGDDGYEGVHVDNCIGTYLHGSLLPKNPVLADWLITAALARRYGTEAARQAMMPLDDATAEAARKQVLALL